MLLRLFGIKDGGPSADVYGLDLFVFEYFCAVAVGFNAVLFGYSFCALFVLGRILLLVLLNGSSL